jgi:hypothetical protein
LVVLIYQTLSRDGQGWFDMAFSHSINAIQSGNYNVPKELTYVDHVKLVNPDRLQDANPEFLDRLIYFDIVEYSDLKLNQLIDSN